MNDSTSPVASAEWNHLVDVSARELWLGPLQADVNIRIYSRGIGVERVGPARFFRGGRPALERFPFSSLDSDEALESVRAENTDGGKARTLVGRGASSLHTLLSVMDGPRSVPVSALRGARHNFLGGMANGTILAGASGLMFIPEPGASGWLASRTPLRAEDLSHVDGTNGAIRIWSQTSSGPVFEIATSASPKEGFVHWWSSCFAFPPTEDRDRLPALWLHPDGVAGPATVQLVHGGVHIESAGSLAPELRTAGIHIDKVRTRKVRGGATCISFEVLGRSYQLWLDGQGGDVERLMGHLHQHELATWRDDFQPDLWSEVAGQGLTVRMSAPGARELVLYEVEVELQADGLRCVIAPGDVESVHQLRGKHLEVEVVAGRRQYQFRAIHLGVALAVAPESVADTEASPGAAPSPDASPVSESPAQLLHLYPIGDGPRGRSQRRGHFRLRMEEELRAIVTPESTGVSGECVVRELSAAGAQLAISDMDLDEGMFAALVLASGADGGELRLRFEVMHAKTTKSGIVVVGVRFVELDENLQAHVQREVLFLQRQQNKRRDMEDNLPD